MPRRGFATEESYREYKRREYARYYVTTQLYAPRKWTDAEDDFLVKNYECLTREISLKLHRSIKSIEHRKSVLRKNGLLPAVNV